MSGKTVKVTRWQPQQAPPPNECNQMIQIVNESVMSLYNESKQPLETFACSLQQIYRRCQLKVRQLRADNVWDYPYRGKRTWDRRVNEAASLEHDAKIVAVTAGQYRPSSHLFQEA